MVFVFGTSTSMPDCRIGAVIMKIISSTSTTSMNGIMLISDSDVCVPFPNDGIFRAPTCSSAAHPRRCAKGLNVTLRLAHVLCERLFDLRRHFQCKCIEPLRQVADISQKLVIKN